MAKAIKILFIISVLSGVVALIEVHACSVLYYVDKQSGKIYVANNEDYWYDVKSYVQVVPRSGNKLSRLWYGWDNFAQGGINSAGLFFDGAVSPDQNSLKGYHKPKGNLGDDILAKCSTTNEAVSYLEDKKIALTNGHLMFGDRNGTAVVVEWVDGQKKLTWLTDNHLLMTNFLLADTTKGNYPCQRFQAIEKSISEMEKDSTTVTVRGIGNALARGIQIPQADEKGRVGGTLYSTFINLSDMELTLVYKLDNTKTINFDLKKELDGTEERKIRLQ